jgi:very-short-patch-repair endonuclease
MIPFERSFASHEKSKFWNYELNNPFKPEDVYIKSHKKFWFTCDICSHVILMKLGLVSRGNWCSYCSHKQLCSNDDCEFCFNNSVASNEKAILWNYEKNENVLPRNVFLNSNHKYWFDCDICKHDLFITPNEVYNNKFCGYCAHQRICGKDNCEFCFNNSFASNEKVKYWNYTLNHPYIPLKIFRTNHKKFWFTCDYNHNFNASLCHVSNNQWCPFCINKTETKLFEWLNTTFTDLTIQRQKKFEWCKSIRCLPFDFFIEDKNIIIELDGEIHFTKQIKNWSSPEENHKRDLFKMEKALENKMKFIRIYQPDVWKDKNDWKTKLYNAIQEVDKSEVGTCKFIGDVYKDSVFSIFQISKS